MVPRRSYWKLALLVLGIMVAGAVIACEPQDTGLKAWIDEPMPGASFPAGEPVKITFHAYAGDGVAELLISVDGEPLKHGVLADLPMPLLFRVDPNNLIVEVDEDNNAANCSWSR